MPSPDNFDLPSLIRRLVTQGPHKTHPASPRRIRILLGGRWIADSSNAIYVWEHPYYPFLYLPLEHFQGQGDLDDSTVTWTLVEEVKETEDGKGVLVGRIWEVMAGGASTKRVVEFLSAPLKGLVRVEFASVDRWFEEDEPVLVHPKDPFKRVDCLPSTRPVSISLSGTTLATSPFAIHLYETSLPCRYYIPFTSINMQYLRRSSTRTQCPYKGEAEYYDVVLPRNKGPTGAEMEGVGGEMVDGKAWIWVEGVGWKADEGEGEKSEEVVYKDLIWYYDKPNIECAAVKGLACFYNEKVDIEVGGEKLQRPITHFSK